MNDLIQLLRELECTRGKYAAWAAEDASHAQRLRDRNRNAEADMLDNRAREYRRHAEEELKRADECAERLKRQFANVQMHSFHRVYQPTEYKAAAE